MILFSTEFLFHFRCEDCQKWWSIADHYIPKQMTCPHCGTVHTEIVSMEE